MVSHIAKPLHQHQTDVVYSTYKPKNTICNFATFDPFSFAQSQSQSKMNGLIVPGAIVVLKICSSFNLDVLFFKSVS